jgi:hypothetical protein
MAAAASGTLGGGDLFCDVGTDRAWSGAARGDQR